MKKMFLMIVLFLGVFTIVNGACVGDTVEDANGKCVPLIPNTNNSDTPTMAPHNTLDSVGNFNDQIIGNSEKSKKACEDSGNMWDSVSGSCVGLHTTDNKTDSGNTATVKDHSGLKVMQSASLKEYCKAKYGDGKSYDMSGLVKFDGVCDVYVNGGTEVLGKNVSAYKVFIRNINDVIKWILKVAFLVAALSGIWGGFLYIKSAYNGNVDERTSAHSILKNTAIGLAVLFLSWYVVDFIINTLTTQRYSGLK